MKCEKCLIYFCFCCGKDIGALEDSEDNAIVHFEVAFCRYMDVFEKKVTKSAVETLADGIMLQNE